MTGDLSPQSTEMDGYDEYREQWVQTCEVMNLTYRDADAVKFARDCGWDGVAP